MPKTYDFTTINKNHPLTEEDIRLYDSEMRRLFEEFPSTCDGFREMLGKRFSAVYAVGIGDSLYSAGSVEMASWKYLKDGIRIMESHEFNYYHIDRMPADSLVIICSGGGQAARTVESCCLAKKRGATVIALTLVPESRLAAQADHVLVFRPDKKAFIDGSCNYLVLAGMMQILTVKLALWAGDIDSVRESEIYDRCRTYASIGFRAATGGNEKIMKEAMTAAARQGQKKFYFLGSGPNYIVTELGCAKFIEQSGTDGIDQQLEEYAHEQYFVHNRHCDNDFAFLICPEGKCTPRCVEILREMKYLGLTTILLTTKASDEQKVLASYTLETDGAIDEDYYWMAAGNLLTRCANLFAMGNVGVTNFQFRSDEQKSEHYLTIQFSRFCDEVREYDIAAPDDSVLAKNGPQGVNYLKR